MGTDIAPSPLERLGALCPTVSVGLLTADLMHLGSELRLLEQAGVGVVHVDVMDGCFCPMLTVGPWFVAGLQTSLLKDVHLMVREPLDKVDAFLQAGADVVTVHVESTTHIHRLLQHLGGTEVVRGVALNPGSPLVWLEPLLEEAEMVVLLAVDPGWGGQRFLPSTFPRIERAREMIDKAGGDILLCVDGGITRDNVRDVTGAGADLVVAGSAVFDGKDAAANARFMLEQVRGVERPGGGAGRSGRG